MSLIFNQELAGLNIKLKASDDRIQALQKQIAMIQEADKDAIAQRRAIKEANKKILMQKEHQLITEINEIYVRQPYKFKANLSEDQEVIELYSQENKLVRKYVKQGASFAPLEINIINMNKNADIVLANTTNSLYAIMEKIFKS